MVGGKSDSPIGLQCRGFSRPLFPSPFLRRDSDPSLRLRAPFPLERNCFFLSGRFFSFPFSKPLTTASFPSLLRLRRPFFQPWTSIVKATPPAFWSIFPPSLLLGPRVASLSSSRRGDRFFAAPPLSNGGIGLLLNFFFELRLSF